MIIYIKSKREFELWDLLHLNYEDIECNWVDVKLPKEEDEEDEKETSLLKIEIKTDEKEDTYSKKKKYKKIFDTLNLAIKMIKEE
tara:strand:- start:1521 stop:1775 length:255 start_codon:yes stop_codon:yes gene_type:complete